MLLAQVDYLGIFGISVPLIIAMFGVAYRMGQLNENVKEVKSDMSDVKRDITNIQRNMMLLPRRKHDVEDDD